MSEKIMASETAKLRRHEKTLNRILFFPLIATLILIGLLLWQINMLLGATRWVEADQSIAQMTRVYRFCVDAETGVRGYLIDLNKKYLRPYTVAKEELPNEFKTLLTMVKDNPTAVAKIEGIRSQQAQWDAKAAEFMAMREAGRNEEFLKIHNALAGKTIMDGIREEFGTLRQMMEIQRTERTLSV
jgi:CHASE3 domain sensor protein